MKYEELDNLETIASGTIPDGYFGDRQSVEFKFEPESGKTITKAKSGFFNSGLPPAMDAREALWLLRKHHTARNIRLSSQSVNQSISQSVN